jgi:hypothetical protein
MTASLSLVFGSAGDTGAVDVTSAVARFGQIRIVGDSGEDLSTAAEVDLLASETTVLVNDATPGVYSRVRLELGAEDAEALSLDGRFEGNSLRLRAREGNEIDLRCPDGVRLDPGGEASIEVDVDRGRWFSGVDLHDAVVEDDVLLLDPEREPNKDLAERIVHDVTGSFAIHGAPPADGGLHQDDGAGDGGD